MINKHGFKTTRGIIVLASRLLRMLDREISGIENRLFDSLLVDRCFNKNMLDCFNWKYITMKIIMCAISSPPFANFYKANRVMVKGESF